MRKSPAPRWLGNPNRYRHRSRGAELIQPVRELLATERFDRVAEQLMPDGLAIPSAVQLWLGQLVFRIGAIAKGIEQVYPGEERIAVAMADAITRRYKKVSVGFELDPLDQVVVRVDILKDSFAAQRRAIMHDVDKLLGRIAFRSISADAAVNDLADIIQRVQDFVSPPESEAFQPACPESN